VTLAEFALAHETKWPREIGAHLLAGAFEPAPWNEVLGPTAPRGPPNGLLLHRGQQIAQWGDTRQVDMTFSVAKSYMAILAGVAMADGLIRDLDETIGSTVHDGGFDGPHNGAITWRHMLTQTSEWQGTLFGKPDQIDRYRSTANSGDPVPGRKKGDKRPLQSPGSFWEYNDIRVNRLSLALLRRFGRSLRDVFAERIMAPIGASANWRWVGYRNSIVAVGGQDIESVSGGGHWGGGVFIDAQDQALVGQLMLAEGVWNGRRLLPEGWVAAMRAPCVAKPDYGLLWWLNPAGCFQSTASAESYFAIGAGGNVTWIDPAHDIVAVLRWIDMAALPEWISKAMALIPR
jgi:CubicO group peptidase (beta-lactamase class C family)